MHMGCVVLVVVLAVVASVFTAVIVYTKLSNKINSLNASLKVRTERLNYSEQQLDEARVVLQKALTNQKPKFGLEAAEELYAAMGEDGEYPYVMPVLKVLDILGIKVTVREEALAKVQAISTGRDEHLKEIGQLAEQVSVNQAAIANLKDNVLTHSSGIGNVVRVANRFLFDKLSPDLAELPDDQEIAEGAGPVDASTETTTGPAGTEKE
jgi:hypothetical protein